MVEEVEEGEEKEQNEELPGMSEADVELGIMPIANNAHQRYPASHIARVEDPDLQIFKAEELDQVVADFNNIALTEQEGANNLDVQAQEEVQADNADLDWQVTFRVRAGKLLSELSGCQNIRMKIIFNHRLAELIDN